MASEEVNLDTDELIDEALRARVVRERNRVAAAMAVERGEAAATLEVLRSELNSVIGERDIWSARAESAESENRALLQTRVFRWSKRARLLWARLR